MISKPGLLIPRRDGDTRKAPTFMAAQKTSFIPDKPIIHPFAREGVVSFGDRLLWHQLALQLNNRRDLMLTAEQYVRVVMGYYPDAVKKNTKLYPGYFNRSGVGNGMGFRNSQLLFVQLALPEE
jgi:hypothetical protein